MNKEEKKQEMFLMAIMTVFFIVFITLSLWGLWAIENMEEGGPTRWYHWAVGGFCLVAFIAEAGHVIFRRR